ncbi:unnamed protein product [Cuscuta epithymum]|uniref:DNA-directed DNA polymerase n=2 Tax=Cuscuta epithymum TaxID=186058 RepID=A0AAV0CAK7_9ASTE|nr:unnamed protein product [Cuscuta epithymum]
MLICRDLSGNKLSGQLYASVRNLSLFFTSGEDCKTMSAFTALSSLAILGDSCKITRTSRQEIRPFSSTTTQRIEEDYGAARAAWGAAAEAIRQDRICNGSYLTAEDVQFRVHFSKPLICTGLMSNNKVGSLTLSPVVPPTELLLTSKAKEKKLEKTFMPDLVGSDQSQPEKVTASEKSITEDNLRERLPDEGILTQKKESNFADLVGSDQSQLENVNASEKSITEDNLRERLPDGGIPTQKTESNFADLVGSDQSQLEKVTASEKSITEDNLCERLPDGGIPTQKTESNFADLVGSDQSQLEKVTASEKIITKDNLRERLVSIYEKVFIVNNISLAKEVVSKLTNEYRDSIHACDTEVAKIDVKNETPVGHGEIICFSIYSGSHADFGNGKSCVWIDVLDGGGKDILVEFAPFFEDPSIKKVWHNYSFDCHIIENYGLKVSGFYADTMHMARLWDSSRRTGGGYSLEALTSDKSVMRAASVPVPPAEQLFGKVSMKTIFGRKKLKKDGTEGKVDIIPSVEELQRENHKLWVSYSAFDAISTLMLYDSLKTKLSKGVWMLDGVYKGTMLNFYERYWLPFGELLVRMETEGVLVDRSYLAELQKVAQAEQEISSIRFRNWASKYCPDAKYMNVGSDTQLRQLFFGGILNRKDPNQTLDIEKDFKVLNADNIIEKDKKAPTKYCKITLHKIGDDIETDFYTASGWPSVSGDALKALAGKVSADFQIMSEADDKEEEVFFPSSDESPGLHNETCTEPEASGYGTAYNAFGGGKEGIEACYAIASLCQICSIDSLISNFIIPLQGGAVSGKDGRIHCSLNINTETGRLSARRPNLQNQPALEKDRYKIRQAFIASPGNSLIVADYGQLELRILAHLANCESMLAAFKAGGDFHSRTALNMYSHIREAVEQKRVLLEWHPQPGEDMPPVPLLKDAFASERRKAKMLNFSIAYGKTTVGLARDWKVSVKEAKETVDRWYSDRKEVLTWQEQRKSEAHEFGRVYTLLGRTRLFPSLKHATNAFKGHIERAAINTPVQGSAADVAMCAMLEISKNQRLKELGWKLLLQVHDEVILEGPTESAEEAKGIVVDCMSKPFDGKNILRVGLSVDAKCAQNWYSAK